MPRELLKRALPKLRRLQFANDSAVERLNALIEDIEAELARQEDDISPIAYANIVDGVVYSLSQHPEDRLNWQNKTPLYAHPPRKQEPLSFDGIEDCFPDGQLIFIDGYGSPAANAQWLHDFARAIERAHGIGGEK